MQDSQVKRICFASRHANALKSSGNQGFAGAFNVPFFESIGPVFTDQLNLELFPAQKYGGYWRSVKSPDEYSRIEKWLTEQGERVFLKDNLDLSVALAEYYMEPGKFTVHGQMVHKAKYDCDVKSIALIAALCSETIRSLPHYQDASCLCAVPPHPSKKKLDLPTEVVSLLEQKLRLKNITNGFKYGNNKDSVKSLPLETKWQSLEKAGLKYEGAELAQEKIILVDDLYQSGTTMQFVAMKLQEAGAQKIYGLSMAKNLNDSDNQ